ncbi:UNVERIFIED_CONTAM: hypothetical protein Sradi_0301700 [Sesamum radiatum]|uniref:DDE Tnp4 domain-containing protein n=1 Tax=Sesamum radiatum TaxID=300843 RepID=A0AAW2W3J9_SESRA
MGFHTLIIALACFHETPPLVELGVRHPNRDDPVIAPTTLTRNMEGTQSGSRRSRDEYEDTAFSQSPPILSPNEYTSSPQPSQTCAGPSGSGRRVRRGMSELQATSYNMASSFDEGSPEPNSASASPGTPGTPGIDALTSRGLLPHGQTSRDCVGAMDGSLVPAWVPRADGIRYRSRKGGLAQNVLAICDFDMNFTYVYAGWEGSAADARVLDHAVSHDPTFPFPPIGKYYLVDAGFTNYQCFLAPYRGTRYHLPEWRGQGRRYGTPQDMFNHAHSRLRNVIERCFGVLKKRFPILQWGMPSYLLNHQVDIVIACCTLHNFIRKFSNDDLIFNEPDEDTPADIETFYHRGHPSTNELESQRLLRDSIAMQMWESNHPN